MKIKLVKIDSANGEEEFLTVGKVYSVISEADEEGRVCIFDDSGRESEVWPNEYEVVK